MGVRGGRNIQGVKGGDTMEDTMIIITKTHLFPLPKIKNSPEPMVYIWDY